MADALTPPQGLISVINRKTIYGLPMGIGTGGGGTKVKTSFPPTYKAGSGMSMTLVGDYTPAVRPPVIAHPVYPKTAGSGQTFRIFLQATCPTPTAGGGQRIRIVTDVIPIRNGAAMSLPSAIL